MAEYQNKYGEVDMKTIPFDEVKPGQEFFFKESYNKALVKLQADIAEFNAVSKDFGSGVRFEDYTLVEVRDVTYITPEQEKMIRELIVHCTVDGELESMMELFAEQYPDHPLVNTEEKEDEFFEIGYWEDIPDEYKKDFVPYICGTAHMLSDSLAASKVEA